MSRLTRRLEEIDAHQRRQGIGKAVEHHLGEAGDALELAARVALGAYAARDKAIDESDVFRVGYVTACKELAMVLRHMRAGTTPTVQDLRAARVEAAEQVGAEPPVPEDAVGRCEHCKAWLIRGMERCSCATKRFDDLAWLRSKVTELALRTGAMAIETDADHDCRSYADDFRKLATELEMAVRGEEYT
jgi:hypothetical protein